MAKYVRYALASVCFAASVAYLALWWRSYEVSDRFAATLPDARSQELIAWTHNGCLILTSASTLSPNPIGLRWYEIMIDRSDSETIKSELAFRGWFGQRSSLGPHFPLWYPALVFAVAGVGVIRFHRQFSIRSALIAFAVVAVLLAMPLAL